MLREWQRCQVADESIEKMSVDSKNNIKKIKIDIGCIWTMVKKAVCEQNKCRKLKAQSQVKEGLRNLLMMNTIS